jgi:negative regulator of flagellin synthesis FlgM
MTVERIGPAEPASNVKKTDRPSRVRQKSDIDSINLSDEAKSKAEVYKAAEIAKGSPEVRLDRIDEVTRGSYVIGFQPGPGWDGRYRKITVKVNRPDVTVLYRHGYYGTPAPGGFNRRSQVTADRLMAAGNFRREVGDIKIKTAASQKQGGTLTIEGKIDLSKITLVPVEGGRANTLDIAVFCLDSAGQPVGNEVRTLPVKLTDAEFQKYQKEGMPYVTDIPMLRGTQNIRFIVYDYLADLIGRADTKVF